MIKVSIYTGTCSQETEFDEIKVDAINIIPPQKTAKVAFASDLAEDGWCPVDKMTFESRKHENVYVLGDAFSASKMHKSADFELTG